MYIIGTLTSKWFNFENYNKLVDSETIGISCEKLHWFLYHYISTLYSNNNQATGLDHSFAVLHQPYVLWIFFLKQCRSRTFYVFESYTFSIFSIIFQQSSVVSFRYWPHYCNITDAMTRGGRVKGGTYLHANIITDCLAKLSFRPAHIIVRYFAA